MFTVHAHDDHGRVRETYPAGGLSREEAIGRLADPPQWTNSMSVVDEDNGHQIVVAFVNHIQTRYEGRCVLDLRTAPDDWRADVDARRHGAHHAGESSPLCERCRQPMSTDGGG